MVDAARYQNPTQNHYGPGEVRWSGLNARIGSTRAGDCVLATSGSFDAFRSSTGYRSFPVITRAFGCSRKRRLGTDDRSSSDPAERFGEAIPAETWDGNASAC